MCRKLILFVLALTLCFISSANAANIVWISEAMDETGDSVQDDQEWVDLLEYLGHDVYTDPGGWGSLDDDKLQILNDADLIIFGRSTNSSGYANNVDEVIAWNSIATPLILMNAYVVRSNRWRWMNSETMGGIETEGASTYYPASVKMEVVELDHQIFTGAKLDENNHVQALDPNADSGNFSIIGTDDVGNGMLLAKPADQDWAFIAEWQAGVETYEGSGQNPAEKRLYFACGAQAVTDGYGGAYNLTDEGQKIFVNAVDYMLGLGPRLKATVPDPYDGQIDVTREPVLDWRAGVFGEQHNVYFSTNFNDVNEATVDDPRDVLVVQDHNDTAYDPEGTLDYGVTYYWRVDELNTQHPDSPWRGDVWSFEALNYPVVIDDFEDYNDYSPNEIFMTWLDGYGVPTNGSTSGYPQPDFVGGGHYMEDTIVHSGDWSMPLFYDNSVGLSEVTRTLNQDWTVEDVAFLGLYYYGDSNNAPEPIFIAVDDAVVTNDDANAALVTEWTLWKISLQEFIDQGVNLSNVGSITIGFGNRANPVAGGEGHVFFDDICLYFPDVQAN
jgi:hypothetical protein